MGEKHLRQSADTGDVEEIRRLLTENVQVNAADSFGFAALEYAMNAYPHLPDKGHLAVVSVLVEGGADVNVQEAYGFTPLHEAAGAGHLEVVKLLLASGAGPKLGSTMSYKRYPHGATALDLAKVERQSQVIELLSLRSSRTVEPERQDYPIHIQRQPRHIHFALLPLSMIQWELPGDQFYSQEMIHGQRDKTVQE